MDSILRRGILQLGNFFVARNIPKTLAGVGALTTKRVIFIIVSLDFPF